MTRVRDVAEFLDRLAPLELAAEWDNVGLLLGDGDAEVNCVVTCLTLTPDVAAEAIDAGAQLVASHHPILFRPVQRLTSDSSEGRMLLSLIRAGVAVYSPHSAYDSAAAGINRQLAEAFGLTEIEPLRPPAPENTDTGGGEGRHGRLAEALPLAELLDRIRDAVGAEHLQYVGEQSRSVERVAVACGSAGEFLRDAAKLGCDAFVTGETRFHTCLQARADGVALVLLGHYASERPAVETLADRIGEAFGDLDAFASRVESDPLKWR